MKLVLQLLFWWISFKEDEMVLPGGDPVNPQKLADEALRAELCALANQFCFTHAGKWVDALLRHYYVAPKIARRAS